VAFGFSIAALAGVSLGLALGSWRTLRGLVEPMIELLRPLCPIAWLPFAIAVFGITRVHQLFGVTRFTGTILDEVQVGMIFILFWGGFFPILINTLDGVAGIRRGYLRLARTLGAGRAQIFLRVRLPAALPNVLTGLRQGIGTCWFVIIAAEMLPGSDSGIGNLLFEAGDQLDMPLLLACMIVIGGFGALLNYSLVKGLGRMVRWHGREA
jgi:NitT/TauT family transport system permease protein